jgi:enoyl-CoA hydratase
MNETEAFGEKLEMVRIERRGRVAIIRMDRPPANAFNLEFAREMTLAFDAVIDRAPGAIVITGTGEFFSGGLDLKDVPGYSARQQQAFLEVLNRMIGRLYACPLPIVAAVNGHSIAGAFVLMLTADYRVGPADDSLFGLTEARVGIPFPAAPTVVLRAELSPSNLRYSTLYARNYGAEEAMRRGVFDEIQPAAQVLVRAVEVAEDLATMPADGYARIKRQFRAEAIAEIERLNTEQSDPMLQSWVSDEAATASRRILEDD